jgi:hypothetical protein
MTKEVKEKASSPRNKSVTYSKALVDRIADKLSDDMSLREVCKAYTWAPDYSTARRWEYTDDYAKRQFRDGRTSLLEAKRKDRLTELRHADLTAIATECSNMEHLSPSMKESLFKAKINHLYKEQEAIYKELEKELPKKYGIKIQQDVNFNDETKDKSKVEIEVLLKAFLQDERCRTFLDVSSVPVAIGQVGKITSEVGSKPSEVPSKPNEEE